MTVPSTRPLHRGRVTPLLAAAIRVRAAGRRLLAVWDAVLADHERQTTPVDPAPHPGPITRQERLWFRVQARHARAFGNPDAARIATLRVYDIDLLEHREEVPG